MNPLETLPCPRCGALAGIVMYVAGGSRQHRAICQRSVGGCGLHLPCVGSAVEAEAEWRRRSVEAALHRERVASSAARMAWSRDPVLIATVIEHYVRYGDLLCHDGQIIRCRIMAAPYEGQETVEMNVQAFVHVFLAPKFAFTASRFAYARVHRILHLNGFPIYEQHEKKWTGQYIGMYRPQPARVSGQAPVPV